MILQGSKHLKVYNNTALCFCWCWSSMMKLLIEAVMNLTSNACHWYFHSFFNSRMVDTDNSSNILPAYWANSLILFQSVSTCWTNAQMVARNHQTVPNTVHTHHTLILGICWYQKKCTVLELISHCSILVCTYKCYWITRRKYLVIFCNFMGRAEGEAITKKKHQDLIH